MKKLLLFLFSLFLGIGIFSWLIKTVGWQEIKNTLLVFTGWQGLAIFALTLLMTLAGTWKWKEILNGEGVRISFKSLFGPYLAGFAVMFLAPIFLWGGEMFRGYALKEKNSIPWSKGMASVIIDRILEWTVNLVVIFFGAIIFLLTIGLPPKKLGIIFGGLFLIFLAGISFFYLKCIKKESVAKLFIKNDNNQLVEIEKEIFRFFKVKNMAIWKSFSLSFLRAAIMYLRAWLLILFLGENIGALPILSILGFTYFAVMIPIPTALGSHEVIQTFAFNSLGLGLGTATAFTMIIRGAELIVASAGVIILFRLGVDLTKKHLILKIEKLLKLVRRTSQ